jgi:dTDP-4-amino-4,6-dideoxygalactose transaminase
MTVPFFDLTEQYRAIQDELDQAVRSVVRSQQFVLGPEVEGLEEDLSGYLGARFAVGCASGTDALLLPLRALQLQPGAEVIVPSFTFFATAGAVVNAGLSPVFCDVDPQTYNVTAETLEAVWTERTAAVIPVHLFGQMASMGEIRELAERRGASVIEDAAQALGAQSTDGMAGSLGRAGAFSFFPTKNLGGFGDGGLVTTNDPDLADRVAKLRTHGGRQMYHHEMVGTNSRLDALQAAVLRVKLRYLDGWVASRRANAERYRESLGDVDAVRLPDTLAGNVHVYNQFTVRAARRDVLRAHLSERGIGTGVYYPVPLHLQPCFDGVRGREGELPVTEALCQEVLSLPIFPELGRKRLYRVAEAIRTFYAQ